MTLGIKSITTTSYTTVLSDATYGTNIGNLLICYGSDIITFIIPPNSSVNYSVGASLRFVGYVIFEGGSGVTIYNPIGVAYITPTIIQTSTNVWTMVAGSELYTNSGN